MHSALVCVVSVIGLPAVERAVELCANPYQLARILILDHGLGSQRVAITYDMVKSVAAELYDSCLKKIPEDTKDALRTRARQPRRNDGARKILAMMLRSAHAAETTDRHVCSDAGVPVYFVKIGTAARLEGTIKQAISDGFDHLVATIDPPILKHVTNPLTNERGYKGKDMPIVSYDLIDGADYVEITCSPKALGSGRWAALEIFSFPDARGDREIRHGLRAQGRARSIARRW